MKKNALFLRKMGMDDSSISTDIKNHRIRTIENIDIEYNGNRYNMFFEFTQGEHSRLRTINKKNGELLNKPVWETIIKNGLYVDAEYRKNKILSSGRIVNSSYRNSILEKEIFEEHLEYTKENILDVVNRYKIGEKFTEIVLVD